MVGNVTNGSSNTTTCSCQIAKPHTYPDVVSGETAVVEMSGMKPGFEMTVPDGAALSPHALVIQNQSDALEIKYSFGEKLE